MIDPYITHKGNSPMSFKQDVLLPLTWVTLFTLTTVIGFVCLVVSQLFWLLLKGWPVVLLGLAVYFFRTQTHALNFF